MEKQGLSEQELRDIRTLADLCNTKDGITLKLNWDMLSARPAGVTNDFLMYEGEELISFLGIYSFGSTEAEISGMVHPRHRRKGVFTRLADAATEECRRRGIPKLIFICQERSASGKAFLQARGAVYSFSEHWMEMRVPNGQPPQVPDTRQAEALELRLATADDIELLTELNRQGFDMTFEDAKVFVETTVADEKEKTYVAELGGKPIGKLTVRVNEGVAFIFGFCVLKEYRGRGCGRETLARTIERIYREDGTSRFELEVAADNPRALGLYESCGFRALNANDYYTMELGE
ncbi:GNAT family N-acetyltransferase [Paenibacillus sp. MZ04-78.2]|uniref:GNAT family N-acetyltransferase n=1 Tax=Paenibacillus sp. MZ04-78.2 TaxID=2962034 RepID=UPI0020B8E4B3|nr:GNAT family N-acetyltransferase [Paenibacillus sp. MZ04-78.2]MCP3774877.1 GNAT family N-acetyltransferase [Paenibacillus sp. MZ04-78.2]